MTQPSKTPRHRFFRAITVLGALAALALPSPVAAADSPFPESTSLIQGGFGVAQKVSKRGDGFALARFHIDFAETHDSKIRDIGVERLDRGGFRGWLNGYGGAPVNLKTRWLNVNTSPVVEHRRLSARCKANRCRVSGLDRGIDKVPVLTGFTFHSLNGPKKIKRIALYPEKRTGPNGRYTYYAHLEGEGRMRYTIDIDVVLVDRSAIGGEYDARAPSNARKKYAEVPLRWEVGFVALQGFDVSFTNGAHELQAFGVGQPQEGSNAYARVQLNDKGRDDPFTAKVWWVDLKPPGQKVIPNDKPLPQNKPNLPGPAPQPKPQPKPQPAPKPKNPPKGKTKTFPGPSPKPKF